MKGKNLVVLVVVLVVLAALAFWRARPPASAARTAVAAEGKSLVDFDVNAVAKITASSGAKTAEVARTESGWVVPTLYNYPADFDKVVKSLTGLADLKVGQVMVGGTELLADFGLAAPPAGEPGPGPGELTLSDDAGKALVDLHLGKERRSHTDGPMGGYPDGQYVRAGDGPVVLIARSLNEFSPDSEGWIKKALVSAPASDVTAVEGAVSNTTWALTVKGYSDYTLAGMEAGMELATDAVRRVTGALAYLNLTGVADPSLKDGELGMAHPARVTFRTSNGATYVVRVGAQAPGRTDRYVRLAASYKKPEPPAKPEPQKAAEGGAAPDTNAVAAAQAAYETDLKKWQDDTAAEEKKIAEQQARFSQWTYLVSSYAAESLLYTRDRLEKKPAPKPAQTNAPPAEAAGPAAAGDKTTATPEGAAAPDR